MEKKYKKSHPWLEFDLKLHLLPPNLWHALDECAKECRRLQNAVGLQERIYLSKGTISTNSSRNWQIEVENMLSLFDEIVDLKQCPMEPLNPDTLHKFQASIMKGIPFDGDPGCLRIRSIHVGEYLAPSHNECKYLLEHLCDWLREGYCFKELHGELDKQRAGIIRAIIAHLYIAWIHPYGGGNGRTARMAEFYSLIAAGIPSAAAHFLGNHCNRSRYEYYRQLSHASKHKTTVEFICFMVHGLREGLREQLDFVCQKHALVWHDYREKPTTSTKAQQRQVKTSLFLYDSRELAKIDITPHYRSD